MKLELNGRRRINVALFVERDPITSNSFLEVTVEALPILMASLSSIEREISIWSRLESTAMVKGRLINVSALSRIIEIILSQRKRSPVDVRARLNFDRLLN